MCIGVPCYSKERCVIITCSFHDFSGISLSIFATNSISEAVFRDAERLLSELKRVCATRGIVKPFSDAFLKVSSELRELMIFICVVLC